jgi:oxalate decarboxylase/phosphoglucose isomerase-like protein (cupin superfamily)
MERQAACPNNRLSVGADELEVRAASDDTDGAIVAADVRIAPGGGPPMLHRHAAAEIYRVLSGELAVYVEDAEGRVQRVAAGAGAVIPIAGDRRHTVRNESAADVLAYVVFAPGAEIEAFMRAAAAAASPGEIAALAASHGIALESGDDFHADALAGGGGPRILDREHGL